MGGGQYIDNALVHVLGGKSLLIQNRNNISCFRSSYKDFSVQKSDVNFRAFNHNFRAVFFLTGAAVVVIFTFLALQSLVSRLRRIRDVGRFKTFLSDAAT